MDFVCSYDRYVVLLGNLIAALNLDLCIELLIFNASLFKFVCFFTIHVVNWTFFTRILKEFSVYRIVVFVLGLTF